jgi:hypothetical protein
MKSFIYPKLPAFKTFAISRIGGNGIANCMFIAARGFVFSKKYNLELIEPTWFNLSIGPYIRNQKDKRHYNNLFKPYGKLKGLKKIYLLNRYKHIPYFPGLITDKKCVIFIVEGLNNYFEEIVYEHKIVKEYFYKIIRPNIFDKLSKIEFSNAIAIHVRMGDYPEQLRTPLLWYKKTIELINEITNNKYRFFLFSDGNEGEFKDLLLIENVQKLFFGNSIADILAISKCCFVIGSDSTFSGWGVYLGQVPAVFNRKHFGRILADQNNELVTGDEIDEDKSYNFLKEHLK